MTGVTALHTRLACHHRAVTEDSAKPPVVPTADAAHVSRDHLRKEGWTMALYVAICLIAALTALENVTAVPGHILGLVWGTTVGLALAHVFAFRVAGRLVHYGELSKADRIVSAVQLAAAAAVAVVVSIPILLASIESELYWARYTCAGIIGAVGYLTARGAEHGRVRAVLFGFAVLALAVVIAVLKQRLVGH
jgi:hypothetical protein